MSKISLLFFILFFLKISAQTPDSLALKNNQIPKAVYENTTDTLVLKNNDVIIGEIKMMNKGVLQIETDYSKEDFKIKWKDIVSIISNKSHMINLSNGDLLNGGLFTDYTTKKTYVINLSNQEKKEVNLQDIVYIKAVNDSFWDRLDASFDVGLKLTKAQNLQQLSINVGLGYTARTWFSTATYKQMQSVQDDIESIRRIDTDLSFTKLLKKDYFAQMSITTLSNTEQDIDLRILSKGGVGKYLIHDNTKYWGIAAGLSFNHEKYITEASANKSLEAFLGTELNIYDAGDFDIQSKLNVFPSLTENKRIRTDFNLDTKYDLPLNFYVKLSFLYNFDSKPPSSTSKNDYVFQTGFGWELD